MREAAGTIIRYVIIALGFLIILQTAGMDLTALSILAGAVGIGVGVGYESDPRTVETLMVEVALQNPDVLKEPAPGVRFLEFGDNGLIFELRAWSETLLHRKGKLISDLNFAIREKFTANGISFPYPQRDIHLRTLPPGFSPSARWRTAAPGEGRSAGSRCRQVRAACL